MSGAENSVLADEPSSATTDDRRVPPELWILSTLAAVAGVVLRFSATGGLWLDEALSVNIAELPLTDLPNALRHDGHPPLYYVVLHGWIDLFGDGTVAVRALSAGFGIIAIPLAYLVGRRRGGVVLGLTTASVMAVFPFAVRYSQEARMYSLVIVLVLAGYLLLDGLLRRGGRPLLLAAGLAVVTAAVLWTHYWGVWLWLATAGTLLVGRRAARRGQHDAHEAGYRVALISMGVGALLFLPWVPIAAWQALHTGTPWAGPVRPTTALGEILGQLVGGPSGDQLAFVAVLVVLLMLGVFGQAIGPRTVLLDLRGNTQLRAEAVVVGLTMLLGLGASYVTSSTIVPRYAAVLVPLLVLLTAAGVTRFEERLVRALALVIALSVFAAGALYDVTAERTQLPSLAHTVQESAMPGDIVVYCPDQLGPAGLRVVQDDLVQVGFPTLDRPGLIDWDDYVARSHADPEAYAQQLLDAAAQHSIFLVWRPAGTTHGDGCERLADALGRARATSVLAVEDGDQFFEPANLYQFPSP